MGRAELLARIDSQELSGWMTLFEVQGDEREEAEREARDRAESGDGVVHYYRPPEDDEDEITDGSAE